MAAAFANEEEVIIAKVNAEQETKVAAKYGVKGYPTLKFFEKGSTKESDFDGQRDEAGIIEFINKKAGTSRLPGGKVSGTFGTIEELNELVKEYLTGDDKTSVITKTKEAASKLKGKYAKYYGKVMGKLMKDAKFVGSEITRLERILKGQLTPKKLDDFNIRLNILRLFNGDSKSVVEEEDEL